MLSKVHIPNYSYRFNYLPFCKKLMDKMLQIMAASLADLVTYTKGKGKVNQSKLELISHIVL